MLVIANGDPAELRTIVREAEWICMETHNALVSSVVYTPDVWARRKDTPLGRNIQYRFAGPADESYPYMSRLRPPRTHGGTYPSF